METSQETQQDDGDLLFVVIDALSADDNVDFEVLSTAQRKDILKDCETVYDYMEASPWDTCYEIPVTARNIEKLRALVAAMETLHRARATSRAR